MAQTTAAGDPSDPNGYGSGVPDSPASWGANGLLGDGRYRLTHRLGKGGMAEVFAAEDVRLGRTVAVKLLRPDLAEDPVSKARFTREAQSVAGLNHHAVVAVYDSGEDLIGSDTVSYIVMELVEGRTIRELLLESDDPPPVEQALIITAGVLEALAYSHQHGIVHRDIKPANVIITNNGAVKVMDFGIARALHGAASTMTQTGMVMGTPQYLSPEQALGKAVDHRSDLYATGCLLYELLTLSPPFTGDSPLSVVYQHVQDMPRPASETHGRVPPELDGLAMRALAKDPDDRFQSAEEMRNLIQYALRMLRDAGGHTGGWNTGTVMLGGGVPPAMGTRETRNSGPSTAELGPPLLLGPPGGRSDDGAATYTDRVPSNGAGKWLKPLLFVVAAVAAISLGVFVAMNAGDNVKTPDTKPTPTPTVSEQVTKGSPDATVEESPPPVQQEDTSGNTDDTSDWSPPYQETTEPDPSYSATTDPAVTETQSAGPTDDGAGGDTSGTGEGDTSGTGEGDTSGTGEGDTSGTGGDDVGGIAGDGAQ